ncbi:extracellular solute-binding protein [Paenibacillus sp. SYP-B3998]|uniref:Extracellular solute-binding protein n=1 Tax=Paenibacillus sp. SYP-B3998 TaxID=2678564 RepID=A0A6G3ZR30_9BACL|nr:extracellular solute-binding protein [Paenibacillus sp. SYP-B3998]NEW04575.1 extracellular solute-binding protein [Paenibacillus sp. SYP-B3998]
MRKIQTTLLASVFMSMSVLSACGSTGDNAGQSSSTAASSAASSSKPAQNITLKYYNWDNDVQAASTKKLIENFQTKNPNIKIEHISLVPNNSVESLKKMDVTMSSGEQVDIVLLPNIEEVTARAAQGVLAPLDDLYQKDNVKAEDEYYINPKFKGKYYATMNTSSDWFVVLNSDALKEANLPVPTFGWTWDDFRDYAKKLTKGDGNDKRYGAYFHSWGEYTNPIVYTDKKNPYLTAELKPQFDDPSFNYYFNLRRAMEKDDKSVKPLSDVIGAKLNYTNEFATGKAAMLMSATFILPNIADTAKYPHTFKTAVAPLPRSSKDAPTGLTNIGGNYSAIAATSKYKEQAYQFIRYMTTEQDARIELSGWKKGDSKSVIERLYGANKDLIDIPSLTLTLNDKQVKTSFSSEIAVSYGAQLKKVMENGFSKYMLDGVSAEDAQKWMVDEADKVIKQSAK